MSIGNLKDTNNLGNNFPFQLKVLQGLQAILNNNCCDAIIVELKRIGDEAEAIDDKLTTQNRTHNIRRTSVAGTIVRPYSFSIANVGTANGTVEGATLAPGETINFDAGVLNNKFGNVNYDPTGTEFLITWVD